MASEADDSVPLISHAPASVAVYRDVCSRIRSLRDLRKFGQSQKSSESAFPQGPVELRKLEQQHFPSPLHTSRLAGMSDVETDKEAKAARIWLLGMLEYQNRFMSRQHELGMFRRAIEKQLKGRQEEWSDLERLYMALTDRDLASPLERLRAAFMVVFHLNERLQHASDMDAELFKTREGIQTADNASIIDDNAGCCPICQTSYTSLADRPIEELLADYPVRIKHCGHIVGKACLEQWMRTPKIEEAKYPYRTCPHCRIKIEGVKSPPVPEGLLDHLKTNRRAIETGRELMYGYDMDPEERLSAVTACMSEEISCIQLLSKIEWTEDQREDKCILEDKLVGLRNERWAWGFRGDGIWAKLRAEWMDSGVIREG